MINGDDILNKYLTIQCELSTQENWNEMLDNVVARVRELRLTDLTNEQGQNIRAFMKDISPPDLRLNLWSELTKEGVENETLVKAVHKWCAEIVLEVFDQKAATESRWDI